MPDDVANINRAKTLYMHIGHGKTGSSFLQSIFSTNREFLLAHDIDYPTEKSDKSSHGQISSGNGALLSRSLKNDSLGQLIDESKAGKVFLSSEFFYHSTDWINKLDIQKDVKLKEVKVLLFIRNPVNLISSMYQQTVKRGGYHGSIDDYTAGHSFFRKLYNTIKVLSENSIFNLTMYNYSNHKKDLKDLSSNWLSIEPFPNIPYKTINRSLTYSELFFQREVNRYYGSKGKVVSDALCTLLPDLTATNLVPSKQALREFMEREGRFISKINELIPSKEHLQTDFKKLTIPDHSLELSAEQIRIICRSIGQNFNIKKKM